MSGLPKDGKIVVASPALAARLHEKAPEHAKDRIFTIPGMKAKEVYVIDVDAVNSQLEQGLENLRFDDVG